MRRDREPRQSIQDYSRILFFRRGSYTPSMIGEFEVRTVRQLRAINAPTRRAIFEALLDGPLTAAAIGERCGQSPEAAHYHLKQLIGIGLVQIGLQLGLNSGVGRLEDNMSLKIAE